MKKVFITGGTGFLGKHVIARLQKEHYNLSGLARSQSSAGKLNQSNVKTVHGSLENIHEWSDQLQGIDIVIHCAAPVEFWGPWEKYQIGIVDATKTLFQEAEKKGVQRFIFISSESVLQDKKDLIGINETEPYPAEPNSYYGKSKMMAEQYILAQNSNMTSIILRPTFIWGTGVPALETIIGKIKSKDFMWIHQGEISFEMVHVDNVAESIFLACSKGKDKGIYFVTDNNSQTVRSFLSKLISSQNVALPKKNIGKGIALFLAGVIEFIWKTFNLKSTPMITKFDVAFVAMGRKYDISTTIKELGYSPVVSEEEGLKEMIK